MKKLHILYTAAITLLSVAFFSSCQKAQNPGGTATQSLANEWWVKIDDGHDATGDFGPGYYNLSTYNTAANLPTEMWIDDMNNSKSFWDIKGKVAVNGLTFSGNNIVNQDYSSTFTITNGKVIPNGAKGPSSKAVTDSIFFNIVFSDQSAPGVVHKVSGYARTRFSQDDN